MAYDARSIRHVFGVFLISIAVGIALSASLVEVAHRYNVPYYLYPIIWIGILPSVILVFRLRYTDMFKVISSRLKQSVTWPFQLKLINGICWAAPFMFIAIFPNYYSYLILLGIGLGNTSTFFIMRRFSGVNFYEQLIVGSVSLVALQVVMGLDSLHILSTDMLEFLARLFIAFAYGAGGTYSIITDVI